MNLGRGAIFLVEQSVRLIQSMCARLRMQSPRRLGFTMVTTSRPRLAEVACRVGDHGTAGDACSRDRLGGLIHEYYRAAA